VEGEAPQTIAFLRPDSGYIEYETDLFQEPVNGIFFPLHGVTPKLNIGPYF
jgi:hypothetical protein